MVNKDKNCLFRIVSIQVYGDALVHAEVRRRCLDYMEAKAKHYHDFVVGSAPPSAKDDNNNNEGYNEGAKGGKATVGGGVRHQWGANLPVN